STLRLKRDEMALEEPTVALRAGVPEADATLRLKRDDLSLEEPTVALQAGVPAAEATLRLKRDDLSFEEPTQALERPQLRTAMEVIDEATQAGAPQAKPSVMLPDATDIPSWEETTQFFTPPQSGHGDATVQMPRPLEPAPVPVDPSDSMDETFPNAARPARPEPPVPATSSMLVSEIAQTEEETLVLPDMHELDELPNAMKATLVMPVMEPPKAAEAPEPLEATVVMPAEPELLPEPMEKTLVMPVMEPPKAAVEIPEPMEATLVLHAEPSPVPGPTAKTLVMPVMEAPAEAPEGPEPMEATVIMKAEPPAEPAPQARTQVMPVMEKPEDRHELGPMEATVVLTVEPKPEPMETTVVMPVMEAPADLPAEMPLPATTIMPVQIEEPSAYLTRQGQAPWPAAVGSAEPSPASTQLMSESVLSKAMEATHDSTDSALAPIPPEATSIEADSPLAKAASLPAMHEGDQPAASRPFSHPPAPKTMSGQTPAATSAPPPTHLADQGTDRAGTTVDTSIGMAVTPATLLMPVQHPLDPTVPIQKPAPALTPDSAGRPSPPQPMQKRPGP
ncbi:MAG: hypothetical protein KGN80_12595, partial [Acidobacteriota bacterium]|nr:hypothetical protein [Acidobacteriota bacterium]